ncbi:unnamed protein product [Ilex paraguariensis]
MEESRKRQAGYDGAGDVFGKRPKTPSNYEETISDEDEDMMAWLNVDDDTVTELSKFLDSEITTSQPFKVKFIEDPYSSALIFQSSSSYITINGNEESCGSSFSDLDSSVMASIDMSGVKGAFGGFSGWFSVEEAVAFSSDAEEARGWIEDRENEEGSSVKGIGSGDFSGDYDDDLLAKFLDED